MKCITVLRNKAGTDLTFHAKTQMGEDCQDYVLLACAAASREGSCDLGTIQARKKVFKQGKKAWWDGPLPLSLGDVLLVSPAPWQRRSPSRPCQPGMRCSPWAGDPALCPPSQGSCFCSLPPAQGNSWVASGIMGVLLSSCPYPLLFFKTLSSFLAASVLPFPLYCICLCHGCLPEGNGLLSWLLL